VLPRQQDPNARLSADGLKILASTRPAECRRRDPAFNYQTQVSEMYPRKENIYRLDYNLSTDQWKRTRAYISNSG